jgi:hypothetical protein
MIDAAVVAAAVLAGCGSAAPQSWDPVSVDCDRLEYIATGVGRVSVTERIERENPEPGIGTAACCSVERLFECYPRRCEAVFTVDEPEADGSLRIDVEVCSFVFEAAR